MSTSCVGDAGEPVRAYVAQAPGLQFQQPRESEGGFRISIAEEMRDESKDSLAIRLEDLAAHSPDCTWRVDHCQKKDELLPSTLRARVKALTCEYSVVLEQKREHISFLMTSPIHRPERGCGRVSFPERVHRYSQLGLRPRREAEGVGRVSRRRVRRQSGEPAHSRMRSSTLSQPD